MFTTESVSQDAANRVPLGYRVELSQQNDRVTGTGHKATENGRTIAPAERTPIRSPRSHINASK